MSNSEAHWLIWAQGLLCGIQAFMGVKCIKEGGAVLKQSLDLAALPCLLIYQTINQSSEHQSLNICASAILITALLWFVTADIRQTTITKRDQEYLEYHRQTQYPTSDEEAAQGLLMSWKEAEEAIIDELRLSKKEDDSNMEDSKTITVEKHQ